MVRGRTHANLAGRTWRGTIGVGGRITSRKEKQATASLRKVRPPEGGAAARKASVSGKEANPT